MAEITTITISKEFNERLARLAKLTAKKENISIVSVKRPLLLEKMANVYEKHLSLND